MKRNAPTSLEDLDLATREAMREIARRSGLNLESWVAAVAEQSGGGIPSPKRTRRIPADDLETAIAKIGQITRHQTSSNFEALIAGAATERDRPSRDYAARTVAALDSVASWIKQAERRLDAASRATADQQDRLASALAEALGAIKERLDAVERQVASDAAGRRRAQAVEHTTVPVLDAVAALRSDLTRLAGRLDQPKEDSSTPLVDRIRSDIEQLRDSLRNVATRDEVAVLECLVRTLADDISHGRADDHMSMLVGSIADLQRQVHRLSDEITEGVHRRIAAEVDALTCKIALAAANGVKRSDVEGLGHQLAEIRHALGQIPEPKRVERLSEEVAALGRQTAELRLNQIGRNDFASLKSALEEIRAVLGRSEEATASADVPNQLQSLSRRIDILVNRPEPANVDPISRRLVALTEQLARVPEPLLERFDRLEGGIQQLGQADMADVRLMLRSLGERLDRAPVTSVSLDQLEEKIEVLTGHLKAITTSEPLQRSLSEALAQVKSLREEASQMAERAAKAAVAQVAISQAGDRARSRTGEMEALRQGFAELKALHASADKKTLETLKAVHNALETLVMRQPASAQAVTPGPAADPPQLVREAGEEPSPAARLEAAMRKLHAAALSQTEMIAAGPPIERPPAVEDELPLEPGTPRPIGVPRASFTASEGTDLGAVRASFIAAARRAAQAQNGEPARPTDEEEDQSLPTLQISNQTLIERIRQIFDSHSRPLFLGLAVLILAAGSMQIMMGGRAPEEPATVTARLAESAPEPQDAGLPPGADIGDSQAEAAVPAITGSLLEPKATTATPLPSEAFAPPAQLAKRQVDMGGLGELPSTLPDTLRQTVIAGEPDALYEAALRAVEGRGMPRDPALAARLFRKAAEIGHVPAQYRLASLYEGGVGVARDLVQAKTWYAGAAKGGNARAMHNLAVLLAEGVDGKPDYAAAQRWFTEAAETGVRDSQFNLGVLLASGLGTRRDLAQSYKWFALAAAQGDEEAGGKRDEVAARLSPGDLAAAKVSVERWRARTVKDVSPAQGLNASTPRSINGRG